MNYLCAATVQVKHWRATSYPVDIRNSCRCWDFEEQKKKLLAKSLHTFLLSLCITLHFTALQCDHMQHNVSIWIIYRLKALKKGMTTFTEIQMQRWFSLVHCKVLSFGTYCQRKVHLAVNNYFECRSVKWNMNCVLCFVWISKSVLLFA